MGYYIWRGGSWQRVEVENGGAEHLKLLFMSGGSLRVAPRRRVVRLLQARVSPRQLHSTLSTQGALRRAATLPTRPHRRRHRSRKVAAWPAHIPCCHAATAAARPTSCNQHQQPAQQSTQAPYTKTEQPQQTELQNNQLQNAQQNNQLQTEQQNNQLQTEQQNNQLQTEQQNNQLQDSSETSECKELMLDYGDVICIKGYVQQHPELFGKIDNNLFNENEVYRSTVLYRFQPLVKIERLKSIENYFRNNMNLKEFAANLGLTHIDDAKRDRKLYVTRSNRDKNFSNNFGKRFFDKGSNKENYVGNGMGESETHRDSGASSLELEKGERVSEREINNLLNEPKHLQFNTSELKICPTRLRERDSNRAKALSRKRKRDDDSDSVSAKSVEVSERERASVKVSATERDNNMKSGRFFSKKDRSNFVKSSRVAKSRSYRSGNGREYSSLEDHAIVAWIHNGGRSRLVNGNRVWRQLQQSYCNITAGQFRSWQSLRNRYLRHILPSLPTLHLATHVQETLRAHAAIGEIKLSRKKSMNRRNSIFKSNKVESAWSRQPRTQGRLHTKETEHTDTAASPTRDLRHASTTTNRKDEVTNQTTRRRAESRRTRPNSTESSESDQFQPKPTRLNSDERRNNDIKRLAQRLMRTPRSASKSNNEMNATKKVTSATNNMTNATNNVTNATNNVTNTTKTTRQSTNNVTSVNNGTSVTKNVTNSTNSATNSTKNTRQSTKNVTNPSNNVTNSTNNIHEATKHIPNETKNTRQSSNNVSLSNKLSNMSPQVLITTKTISKTTKSDENTTTSVIKTRNSVNNHTKSVDSTNKSVDNFPRSLSRTGEHSARTARRSANMFNAANLRSPRTLGGNLYASPNTSGSLSHKPRLSADKQMARRAGGGHKRALFNHRAIAL